MHKNTIVENTILVLHLVQVFLQFYHPVTQLCCQLEIQTVPGIKNVVFGGEGLFNTVVTGPGRVWLQSMPVSQLAGAIRPFIPTGN